MPGPSRSKKDKRQSMANARACAAEDRHSKRAKVSTSDPSPLLVRRESERSECECESAVNRSAVSESARVQ